MKIEQKKWTIKEGWQQQRSVDGVSHHAQLVFVFGERELLHNPERFAEVRSAYPNAHILQASTAGDILGSEVIDQAITVTAIFFEKTSINTASCNLRDLSDSFDVGRELALSLPIEELTHVLVFSDGQNVNGSQLVKGMTSHLPYSVKITGGLAGDGSRFTQTLVGLDAPAVSDQVVAIGLYGSKIKIGYGSVGGWDTFGPERKVTFSKGNRLYELDGMPALELYKTYLGEDAKALPSSALLFPLAIRLTKVQPPLVRTVLNIDEGDGSMIFAGDVPEGSSVQLMKANIERLIEGASAAAKMCVQTRPPELAIIISCVGRRMVLGKRTVEELINVEQIFGKKSAMTGFYSYGEIAPTLLHPSSELHNQTITITTLSERE